MISTNRLHINLAVALLSHNHNPRNCSFHSNESISEVIKSSKLLESYMVIKVTVVHTDFPVPWLKNLDA